MQRTAWCLAMLVPIAATVAAQREQIFRTLGPRILRAPRRTSPRLTAVTQSIVRTTARGEPMEPFFRDLTVVRHFEASTRTDASDWHQRRQPLGTGARVIPEHGSVGVDTAGRLAITITNRGSDVETTVRSLKCVGADLPARRVHAYGHQTISERRRGSVHRRFCDRGRLAPEDSGTWRAGLTRVSSVLNL
jgi:hypothetical protein